MENEVFFKLVSHILIHFNHNVTEDYNYYANYLHLYKLVETLEHTLLYYDILRS